MPSEADQYHRDPSPETARAALAVLAVLRADLDRQLDALILEAYDAGHLSIGGVAEALGVARGTVQARLNRIRRGAAPGHRRSPDSPNPPS